MRWSVTNLSNFSIGMDRPLQTVLPFAAQLEHEPRAKDFATRPIRDFIPHMKINDRFPPPSAAKSSAPLRPGIDLSEAGGAFFGTLVEASGITDTETPRNRFLRSIEVFSILLLHAAEVVLSG